MGGSKGEEKFSAIRGVNFHYIFSYLFGEVETISTDFFNKQRLIFVVYLHVREREEKDSKSYV